MPVEQEAQEVARGHRFDFGPEPADRIVMDAREQPPVTPLFGVAAGCEAAAQGKAFDFQADQRGTDLAGFQAQRRGQRGFGDRAYPFQAAAQDLGECLSISGQILELRCAFGGNPERCPWRGVTG